MCGIPGLFSHVCIGDGMSEAVVCPKTALTTPSVSQVGDFLDGNGRDDDNDNDSSAIDDCRDGCSDGDPSEVANDGRDDEEDKDDSFLIIVS
mmetsp:Transcript_25930/g.44281  ORF Transcript_25930/g.44281 Transcript_25930/m.44281 type:complete len:92 (+) Transcript_25930:366-641(+)